MCFSVFKRLSCALAIISLFSSSASADWRSTVTDKYKQRSVESFTKRFNVIPTTKALTDKEEYECFRIYDDEDLARDTKYHSAFDLMFNIEQSFVFPDEQRFNDFEELNRPDRENNRYPSWLDYRAYDVIVGSNKHYRSALNTPENFLLLFTEMEKYQGAAPCYIDYTRVREKLKKLKNRVVHDIGLREKFHQFEAQVSGKSINDLSAPDIDFLNSVLADTEIVLSEIRFAAYNIAGLLLIRSNDKKLFLSKDRENKQKAIYFWEYAAIKGQSIDAMLNLFLNQNLIEKERFISIADSFKPSVTLNKVGLFQLYSPRMQRYDASNSDPTPQNTLLLASSYMRHPAFEWRRGNRFMHTVGILTYAGNNKLKDYVENQKDRAIKRYEVEKKIETIAFWAAIIGTTAVAIGQLSDGGNGSSTADDLFSGQMQHIDNVMVGAYAISLD